MRLKFSLATHVFLYTLIPICLIPLVIFFVINKSVKEKTREGLHESLHQAERILENIDPDYGRRFSQLLTALGESSKQGSWRSDLTKFTLVPADRPRLLSGIEAQMRLVGGALDYDLLILDDGAEKPIAGFLKENGGMVPLDFSKGTTLHSPNCFNCHASPTTGVVGVGGTPYEIAYVPLRDGKEIAGSLLVGRKLNLRRLNDFVYTALVRDGEVLLSTFPPQQIRDIERQFRARCSSEIDGCEIEVEGKSYLSLRPRNAILPGDASVVMFASIDAAASDLIGSVTRIVFPVGAAGVLAALALSALGARSISRPIRQLTADLTKSETNGRLRADFSTYSPVKEVNRLAGAFNRAADAIQEAHGRLEEASLEFMETMIQALEARDPYTSGHSARVAITAAVIAEVMDLPKEQVERIRIGSKLHDIGKIGIPDAILQKPGRLTPEEYAQIKLHTLIGKKILENVGRFADYLDFVELHHENYDGSGYPHGLKGEEIPLPVRIVHVADVYDAMTSSRSYRDALPEEQVLELLALGSGRLFDPIVVEAFVAALHRQVGQQIFLGGGTESDDAMSVRPPSM